MKRAVIAASIYAATAAFQWYQIIKTTPFVASGQAPRYHWVEYIVDHVGYDDAFGIAQWKKFCCWTADAAGNLWNCKYGNGEDKNPELPPK